MEKLLRIGEIAKSAGVDVQTVRWYERVGLLRHAPRSAGGYRLYDQADTERLGLIRQAKTLGLSLGEIQRTLELLDEACCDDVRPEVVALLGAKIAAIDARISELQTLRERLAVRQQLVLEASRDKDAQASCTPSSCVCLEAQEASPLLRIERSV